MKDTKQPAPELAPLPVAATPKQLPPPPTKAPPAEAKAAAGKGGPPLFRMVNTKRITLNFEVKDLGESGLSAVELWYTEDGKEWKKYDAPTNSKAYVVEVAEEGMYGFTLIARSGTGLAKDPPQAGDAPQVWVIVDLTRPDVELTEVKPSLKSGPQQVAISWKASDKNMGRQPISLSYAEKDDGPWRVIASGLENNGQYTWDVPKGVPGRALFRVEATDLAGNVGKAQIAKPVMMDNKTPSVSIVGVDVR